MSTMQQELHSQRSEERARRAALVEDVEKRRTPRDRNYALTVDGVIARMVRETDVLMGERPPQREPLRRVMWDNEWTRRFHSAMDDITAARGLRRQSHQRGE